MRLVGGNRYRATQKKSIMDKVLLPADQLQTHKYISMVQVNYSIIQEECATENINGEKSKPKYVLWLH